MRVTIKPSCLKGAISVPPSKSSMQRACAAALLCKRATIISNPGHSNDDKAILNLVQQLGANVKEANGKYEIKSSGIYPGVDHVHCGESGLGIRMFTPIIAMSDKEITIHGEGSLLNRPMNFFDQVLPQLGVSVQSNDGKLPVKVKGPLRPGNIEIDGSISSQFLTGLLMAYSTSLSNSLSKRDGEQGTSISIKVKNLKSKPYIDLTLDVMKHFGLTVPENVNYKEFIFPVGSLRALSNEPIYYTVEGDWSGGAFLLVAGAIAGPVTVRGLDLSSSQADRIILDVMMNAHAAIAVDAKGIIIHPGGLMGFEFDATDCPDLFPPLVALAAYSKGVSKIKGIDRLAHKESNRAAALQQEFGKMGVKIELIEDIMVIHGSEKLTGATVHSHHDHRIAMACTIAALKAEGETVIEEAQAINKSYPDFFWHFKKLGADVSLPYKKFLHE